MGQDIILKCSAKKVGMEIMTIEVIFPEDLGITDTDKCYIRNAFRSSESNLQVVDRVVFMRNGSFGFFLEPVGLSVHALINFFFDGGEASISYPNGNLKVSKKKNSFWRKFYGGILCILA